MINEANTQEILQVPIDRITRAEQFQVRKKGTNRATVNQYASAIRQGVPFPPVRLARVDGVLYCVDGFHRIQAHLLADKGEVEATIVDATTVQAGWLAAEGNLTHGAQLTAADLREAFKRYIKAKKHRSDRGRLKSYRDIALGLGGLKSHTTIRNWMKSDFPAVARAMGGNDPRGGKFTGRAINQQDILRAEVHNALTTVRNGAAGLSEWDRTWLTGEVEAVLKELRSSTLWEPQEPKPF